MNLTKTIIAGVAALAVSFPVFAADEVQAQQENQVVATNDQATQQTGQASANKDGAQTETVNINTADEKALTTLKGIGKKKAKAIVNYRNKNGKFNSVDDLKKVKGINDKIIKDNQDRLAV